MTKKPRTILYLHQTDFDQSLWKVLDNFDNHHSLFDAVYIEPKELEKWADKKSDSVSASAPLIVGHDFAQFSIRHPLVEQYPSLFSLRRTTSETKIDPRRPQIASGEARARFHLRGAEVLIPEVARLIDRLSATGAAGIRLLQTHRFSEAILNRLVDHIRENHPRLLIYGDADSYYTGLFDGVFQPADRDRRSMLSPIPDAAFVIAYADRRIGRNPRKIEARIASALAESDGVMVDEQLVHAARQAVQGALTIVDELKGYQGERRRISARDDDVTVVIRIQSGGLRDASSALIVAVNNTPDRQEIDVPAIIQASGALMSAAVETLILKPQETRLVQLHRSDPVIGSFVMPAEEFAEAYPRLVLEGITPRVSGGDFAVKKVVGDRITIEADAYADGHEQLAAELLWRAEDEEDWHRVPMAALGNDRWRGEIVPDRLGRYRFAIEGWIDVFGGFRRDFRKKVDAGVAMPVDYREGRALVEAAAERVADLKTWVERLNDDADADALLSDELATLMAAADERPHRLRSAEIALDAERLAARYSSWYELFPRSQVNDPSGHGTFIDVIDRLPAIRDMGFDTLYFPPVHPIGLTNRKGPNNTLTPGPDDPGSPYAIGSEAGGHDAVHPLLGGFEAFGTLVTAARDHGIEIALDFAIQCSPDHPWLKDHPGWFAWRPDGSMKYAENPPKKYQDIVNVDFYGPDAIPGLWVALRDVVLLWIEHGVKTFRVDNPHTKPLPFWEWMIGDVRSKHPEVIFLAEAFTRPAMMYRLAKVGFSQSYTYFTWRDRKEELTDYITELTTSEAKDFYRPHFFVNTPDINPVYLQTSGRPGFRIRAVLAATLSGLFGVYSGFELCESAAIPGKEEYLDSEKYIVKPRDWEAPGNIIADITLLNQLRRQYAALQTHLNTRFYVAHDENIIWYGKPDADGRAMIMVMVNLDPHREHDCLFEVPLWEFGIGDTGSVAVEDLAAGHRFNWQGKEQYIRIAPDEPYRIWRITPGASA